MKNKEITFEERKILESLLAKNWSYAKCAKEMNRPPTSIVGEITRNGGRYKYTAIAAENRKTQIKDAKNKKLSKLYQTIGHPIYRMKNRIENIEMQLEIIIDQLKEILNDRKNN